MSSGSTRTSRRCARVLDGEGTQAPMSDAGHRTKNRTRIWCNPSTCGARVRAKSYRQRRREGADRKSG
ncbi:MAG: CGNR zinc finger domain-containing protein [Actinomycetota bacterium]